MLDLIKFMVSFSEKKTIMQIILFFTDIHTYCEKEGVLEFPVNFIKNYYVIK